MTALFPLGVLVEIDINGTWTDVTHFVYQRDTLTITGGKTTRSDTNQPASVTITFNNRDGRFSPNNTSGLYYPYLQRNTQLRISINDTSSSGNVYNGFRFWGEVSEWPPVSDISGNDIYVQATASGPLRRILSGGGEGSALQRYYAKLTGSYAPIAYWPCEEDPDTGLIGTGVQGGANMTIVAGAVKWKAVSNFNGSSPIGVINKSTWTGITSAFGTSGDDVFLDPGTWPWVASTSTVDVRCIGAGGGGIKGQAGTAAGGSAGGGGEFARESTLAVTPGQLYSVVVGAGGAFGAWNVGGSDGADSTFAGDSVTCNANGGGGAGPGPTENGGAAGTGSSNTTHHNGGAGAGHSGASNAGAGGGSSGGTSSAGNAGSNAAGIVGGSGGAAVTGGGAGGDGGGNPSGNTGKQTDGKPGGSPGGGGGGGWANNSDSTSGGNGAPGSVELVYTGSGGGTQPNNNVLRFIMWVPAWGGNPGKVMIRGLTSGTIAKLDVQYIAGGNIRLFGYSNVSVQLFDSGNLAVGADATTLMVSVELAKSGANVAWAFSAIQPGADGVVAKTNGTVTTASMGSVSQVVVDPDGNITKTAIGHISIQYALIPLWKVSQALNGHDTESGIGRFVRLTKEELMNAIPEYNEGADHWGFESGTQSWTVTNGALTNPATTFTDVGGDTWPVEGTHSLLLTANGGGSPSATAPSGTSGQPVVPGDVVSLNAAFYGTAAITNCYLGIKWYTAAGSPISETDRNDFTIPLNEIHRFWMTGAACIAPATAAFFAPTFGAHSTLANGTKIYVDDMTIAPSMGPQSSKSFHAFLTDIQNLDASIMKEAKETWGLKCRTRIKLINQSPAITLDYSKAELTQPLAPVIDTTNVKNDITVKRHKGSKVQVTLASGSMSILEPPQGTGRHKKTLTAVAAADEQLAALASQLLLIGTVSNERYPTITVNLARCGRVGDSLAPLMSAIAGVEIGDVVQINNLPFWFPSTTTQQMVVGYTETINTYEWTITWNCVPYIPYVQVTSTIRRW